MGNYHGVEKILDIKINIIDLRSYFKRSKWGISNIYINKGRLFIDNGGYSINLGEIDNIIKESNYNINNGIYLIGRRKYICFYFLEEQNINYKYKNINDLIN